jgi:hypothetical protein
MPEARYPKAVWQPGVNAGYRAGRTMVRTAVCHFTVGRASAPIGERGYFQFLIGRDGTVTQFAETDAVCWHGGDPWNSRGPGIEVEYLPGHDDVMFTDAALAACGDLVRWLHDEWLVPLDFYDGPRVGSHHGFITHRSLIQTGDAHSDYWSQEDWDRMVTPTEGDDLVKPLLLRPIPAGANDPDQGKTWVYDPYAHTKTWVRTGAALERVVALLGQPDLDPAYAPLIADAREVTSASAGGQLLGKLKVSLVGEAAPI